MLVSRFPNFLIRNIKSANCHFRNISGTAEKTVLVQEIGKAGVITLNRPNALNAVNLEMVSQILPILKSWESTRSLVIIKGAGEKAFCAGGDVLALTADGGRENAIKFFTTEYSTNALTGSYKIPYIALIHGITMGGGVGLSVHSKYRVATEKTMFAMPETAIGLFPDVGGSHFLPRLSGNLGYYLGLTGYRLKGKDVLKAGIATHYIESSRLSELEEKLVKCSGFADVDKVLKETCTEDNAEFVLEKHLKQINKCFSGETVEQIIKNLEDDGSDWAKTTLKTLSKMSPLSMKVSLKQLQLGANLNLQQCLQMEIRMAVRHVEKSDFKEGVRALLVDKDQKPQWSPKTVEEVTEDMVNFYFTKLPDNLELKFGANSKL